MVVPAGSGKAGGRRDATVANARAPSIGRELEQPAYVLAVRSGEVAFALEQ
jgi:hypothetical protein